MSRKKREDILADADVDAYVSKSELWRYERQIKIFGEAGQKRLKKAKVTIAGAGGLGSVSAAYLTVAGVGKILVVDNDVVELSNLNRQILHWEKDIGRKKTESFAEKLLQMNPEVELTVLNEKIVADNVADIVRDSDLIVDAMDNFQTRYLLNRVALEKNMPFFHGGVYGFEGQVTTIIPGATACLRCIFPEAPAPETLPVIGATCGVIGGIQATEVVKYIVGVGELLTNRLLVWDGADTKMEEFAVERNPACEDCGDFG
ncbi:MAG: HesA/MoeB/ThiF family protein [Candidatus Syntrophoarchaeum sp.]|nr:HesA/MoeB/ThiF family protein [Methanomicrobia archaeon]MBL7118209.1 HesA/MoeB/ThiF family protein [Candidatus Syntrophoarchaeum sp.]